MAIMSFNDPDANKYIAELEEELAMLESRLHSINATAFQRAWDNGALYGHARGEFQICLSILCLIEKGHSFEEITQFIEETYEQMKENNEKNDYRFHTKLGDLDKSLICPNCKYQQNINKLYGRK